MIVKGNDSMVKKIVLTGGPGSGKTSVLEYINKIYSGEGYKVVIVSETATDLMNSGITFKDGTISLLDFQELVMRLQLAKEEVVDRMIEQSDNEKIIVIYDRGTIDNSAYINEKEFNEVLARLNNVKTFADLMNKYDLVINLVSSKHFYTTENNKARSESASDALKLGETTLKCWLGHKKLKIVMPKETISEKINEVLNVINGVLDEKQVKRQEKFIVDLKRTNMTYILNNSKVMQLEQTYLVSGLDVEKRVRKVLFNGCVTYIFSVFKIGEDGKKVIISEKQIDKKVYESLLDFKDENCQVIKKNRYYFSYNGEYFNLDVFDDNFDNGILEINVSDKEEIFIPDYISVLERVTDNEMYFNRNMALKDCQVLKVKYD